MSIDPEILKEFIEESKLLVSGLIEKLESIENHPEKIADLAVCGNEVDRVMGGAKTLALMVPTTHALHLISDYSAICKAVAYKGSQIKNNDDFFDVVVAFLLDASETLLQLILKADQEAKTLMTSFSQTFIERLKWVSLQFGEGFSESVQINSPSAKMGQDDIDELMKKLGF